MRHSFSPRCPRSARSSGRRLDAVPKGVRRRRVRSPARGDGRQPDRPVRQPEPLRIRSAAAADASDVRRARRAGQQHQPRHQLLGRQAFEPRLHRQGRHRVRRRLRQGRPREPCVPFPEHSPRGHQPRCVRLRWTGPLVPRTVAASGCRRRHRRREHVVRGRWPRRGRRDPRTHRRRAAPDPRGHRPKSLRDREVSL